MGKKNPTYHFLDFSESTWLTEPTIPNSNTLSTVLCDEGVLDALVTASNTPDISQMFFGEYDKWCSSIVCFPISYETFMGQISPENTLKIGKSTYGKGFVISSPNNSVFGMGKYKHTPKYNSFLDFEPYTKIEVYLPYYGYANLKVADIYNKYIYFNLAVDYVTGQALYIISVNDNELSVDNKLNYYPDKLKNNRIIGTYEFTLGITIPFGSTGLNEMLRNVTLSAIKGAGALATSYLSEGLFPTSPQITSTTSTVVKKKRLDEQRFKKTKVEETTKTRAPIDDSSTYSKNRINTCFETANNALANLSLTPGTDKSSNMGLKGVSGNSICIVTYRVKQKNMSTEEEKKAYGKLYGYPVGYVDTIKNMHGYTEISNIHLEGQNFGSITKSEMAMLEEALNDGIILP